MTIIRRRFRQLSIATTFAFAAAGCDGDSTGPGRIGSVVGTWTLRTVNGSNLPFTVVQVGANRIEVVSDVLTVAGGGAFTQLTTVRITENGVAATQTIPDAGTYTINGTAVTFTFQSDGSTGNGTLSGNTLTVAAEGFSLVYQKD